MLKMKNLPKRIRKWSKQKLFFQFVPVTYNAIQKMENTLKRLETYHLFLNLLNTLLYTTIHYY